MEALLKLVKESLDPEKLRAIRVIVAANNAGIFSEEAVAKMAKLYNESLSEYDRANYGELSEQSFLEDICDAQEYWDYMEMRAEEPEDKEHLSLVRD
jgi:hypothetical protein